MEKPLNKYIDHTLLKAEAGEGDIKKLCQEAKDYDFFAVCVNSCFVPLAKACLQDSDIEIASVIGFPLGAMSTYSKVMETRDACENGAKEIDMVINVGMLKDKRYVECLRDIREVCLEAASFGATVKVILETCYLTDYEITKACELSKEAGAAGVKAATGCGSAGATVEHVKLMRETVGPDMGVKASGGIRDLATAMAMIDAGASRIGASAGIQIMEDYKKMQ